MTFLLAFRMLGVLLILLGYRSWEYWEPLVSCYVYDSAPCPMRLASSSSERHFKVCMIIML